MESTTETGDQIGKKTKKVKAKDLETETEDIRLTEAEKIELRKRAIEYKDKIDDAYFEFADLVYQVHDSAAYLDWAGEVYDEDEQSPVRRQYKDFGEYVETELCISLRKANYYVSMIRWFKVDIGDDSVIRKVKKLGWSKVKELVGVVTAENVDEWVEKAERMTVTQLAAECRAAIQGKKGEAEKVTRRSFQLTEDQVTVVDEALEHAGEVAESEKWGHVLTLICQDYMAGAVRPENQSKKKKDMYIERMGECLGVSLIAVDTQSGEIVSGKGLFKKLVAEKIHDRSDLEKGK